jgi:NhaP-type Na+/H+ or K+/H+ antiporter
MDLLELKRRLRRFDALDYLFNSLFFIIIGIIIAAYYLPATGFVQQNLVIVIFILVAVGIRPFVRFWKGKAN